MKIIKSTQGEFIPKVDNNSGHVSPTEALLNWADMLGVHLTPGEFESIEDLRKRILQQLKR